MKFEYSIWNITKGWQPLQAKTLDDAQRELDRMGPYSEEARIRDETGKVYERKQPRPELHFF